MEKKLFNGMTFDEARAFAKNYIESLEGDEWENFLRATGYDFYKDIGIFFQESLKMNTSQFSKNTKVYSICYCDSSFNFGPIANIESYYFKIAA